MFVTRGAQRDLGRSPVIKSRELTLQTTILQVDFPALLWRATYRVTQGLAVEHRLQQEAHPDEAISDETWCPSPANAPLDPL